MRKNISVIIMGPQGSGKGTQSRLLAEKYDLQIFGTGNILREIAKENTEIGRTIDEIINKKGEIVPWGMMKEKVLEQKANELDINRGIVFDGTPRIIEEVSYWDNKLNKLGRKIDYVFYIKVSKEESVKRISSRKLCRENGHPFVVGKDISEEDAKCPICGSEVYRRKDDTPEKVLKRLEWTERLLSPVIEHYRDKKMLIEINGKQPIENIHKEIVGYIK